MLHRGMRGMRSVAQGVQEQHVQTAQQLHGFRRNIAVIGEIRGASKAKPVHRAFSVTKTQGCELEAEEIHRAAVKEVSDQAWNGRFRETGVEDVAKTTPDVVDGLGGTVNRNLASLPEIERAYVVQTHDMVGMRMSEQNGI